MEAVKYTIRDYDKYLTLESGMSAFQKPLWNTNRLDESKGIVDDYIPIIEELYDALMQVNPLPFNNDTAYFLYNLLDYEFKQKDLFMSKCSVIVFTGVIGDSSFLGKNATITKEPHKMEGGNFTIRMEDKFLDSESGKNEFFELMSHEIQHAYRFYKIFLSNNSYKNEENAKIERNFNAYSIRSNTLNPLEYIVSTIYYMSERNEISSESNKLYEFIRNHKEINETNIEKYFTDGLPLFTLKENLRNFLTEMDGNIRTDDMGYVNNVGNIFKQIIGDEKMTPSKAFIKFRTRVIDASMFANRLFKRTIAKAFDDFDRRYHNPNGTDLAIEMMETKSDFELLKEILNKC